jgi:hypothetical protein
MYWIRGVTPPKVGRGGLTLRTGCCFSDGLSRQLFPFFSALPSSFNFPNPFNLFMLGQKIPLLS